WPNRNVVLHPDRSHQPLEAISAENAQQIIFEREIKARRSRVALAPRTAAQLIIDAARLVALGAEDMESARRQYLFPLAGALLTMLFECLLEIRIGGIARAGVGRGETLGIAAQHDIGAAARHVGRDRHRLVASRLRDNLGLALMVLGVEHEMLDAGLLQII